MKKINRVSLIVNVALALILTGLAVFMFACKPKSAVNNVSIFVICDQSPIHIEARDYDSSIIRDILRENNELLKIPQSELDNGYITQINGVTGDYVNGFWWLVEVNYVAITQGIGEFSVDNGAVITLRLVESSYNPWE